MLVARKADGSNPGSALMHQHGEKQEVQERRRSRILWATAECDDWFANGVDARFSVAFRFCCVVQAG
jgi:hypothetical protein